MQSAVTCKGREWKGQFENVCKVNYIGYNSALHFKSTKLQQEQEFGKFHKKWKHTSKSWLIQKSESELQNRDSSKKVKVNLKIMTHSGIYLFSILLFIPSNNQLKLVGNMNTFPKKFLLGREFVVVTGTSVWLSYDGKTFSQ